MHHRTRRSFAITSRSQLIQRIRHELETRGYPRLQMMLLVALTGGAGFLASFTLLTCGVDSLALRYSLAVAIAYLVFLLLLWVWLRADFDTYDGLDEVAMEIVDAIPEPASRGSSTQSEPLVELPDVSVPGIDAVGDADELAIPLGIVLVVAGLVLAILLASVSVIFSAPILFAELIVDGVLAASLYRRLRRTDSRHWLQSAVRRTIVPFAITAALAAIGGWGLSVNAPGARTLGDALAILAL